MTPYEWLEEVTAAANRVVGRTWIGHFDLPAASGTGTAQDALDRMFRSVSASTAALRADGAATGMPFTYGWVPVTEFRESTTALLAAAVECSVDGRADELTCDAATELMRLTIDLADTIGTTYGPQSTAVGATAATC